MKSKPDREKLGRSDDGNAFIPDPGEGPANANDPLAQELAEDFVSSVTSADHANENTRSEMVTEEIGGPFVETDGMDEFADDVDESNPLDAEPAGLPNPMK